jgi:hypothetical protein
VEPARVARGGPLSPGTRESDLGLRVHGGLGAHTTYKVGVLPHWADRSLGKSNIP